jgi:hypothetical protein
VLLHYDTLRDHAQRYIRSPAFIQRTLDTRHCFQLGHTKVDFKRKHVYDGSCTITKTCAMLQRELRIDTVQLQMNEVSTQHPHCLNNMH